MQNTVIPVETIVNALDQCEIWEDIDEVIRPDYSGRAMYGDSCFGLVCGIETLLRFTVALATEDPELADDLSRRVRSDNMGLSTIWYFPGFELDGDV